MLLDGETILSAAFCLLDEDGLDGLTMRALAGRLSVQAPALYWHIEDKAALHALMAQDIYVRARAEIGRVASASEWLTQFGLLLRARLAAHKDGALLLAIAGPGGEGGGKDATEIAAPLVEFGMSVEDALEAQAAVLSLTLGSALYAENRKMATFLESMFDFNLSYLRGLKSLVQSFVEEIGPVS